MNKSYLYTALVILAFVLGAAVEFLTSSHRSLLAVQPMQSIQPVQSVATNPITPDISSSSPVISVPALVPEPAPAPQPDLSIFNSAPRVDVSNVVGYFGGGAFLTSIPDWLAQNWMIKTSADGNMMTITPQQSQAYRDYSDIVIDISTTTESFNAGTLYQDDLGNQSVSNPISISEVFLNQAQDMWIYHVERTDGTTIDDTFYLDGNLKTAVVHFSASTAHYWIYETRIRQFLEGLSTGVASRG